MKVGHYWLTPTISHRERYLWRASPSFLANRFLRLISKLSVMGLLFSNSPIKLTVHIKCFTDRCMFGNSTQQFSWCLSDIKEIIVFHPYSVFHIPHNIPCFKFDTQTEGIHIQNSNHINLVSCNMYL